MKVKKPKIKGNMEEFTSSTNPEEDRIADLLEILQELGWVIASKENTDTGAIDGFIVGTDAFVNDILTKIDNSGSDIDINEHFLGDRGDLH